MNLQNAIMYLQRSRESGAQKQVLGHLSQNDLPSYKSRTNVIIWHEEENMQR